MDIMLLIGEMALSLISVLLILFALTSIVITTLKVGISPMPTSRKVQRELLQVLPNRVEGVIYELGSGWGQVAYLLAKRYPEKTVIGYEISLFPFLFSKLFFRLPNLQFQRQNFYQVDLSDAGLIYCYLFPGAMKQVEKVWKSGILISNAFQLPNTPARQIFPVRDLFCSRLFKYLRTGASLPAATTHS